MNKKEEKEPYSQEANQHLIKWFSELNNKNISIAGGKGASLAEMYNNGFPIPPGFIITAQAYEYLIEKSNLKEKIDKSLENLDIEDTDKLNSVSNEIREKFLEAELPQILQESILEAYNILSVDKKKLDNAKKGALEILKNSRDNVFVAVRSSATTEDLANASFAGQQESFLNVKGEKELLQKVKECFSSLFTARAIYYRKKKGFANNNSLIAVVVQKMIDSEKSGVMFSRNPTKNEDNVVIEAVFGLGEGIVSGRITPDNYSVSGDMENFKLLKTQIADKKIAFTRNASGKNQIVKLTDERGKQQVLNAYEIKILAQYAKKLEEHYKKPQDIEFAISGNEIYIVQSRPITVFFTENKKEELKGEVLVSGAGASPGIASGIVKIVRDIKELDKIKAGDVLVTEMTNPDMVISMQKASAIVTDEGGLTSHAAIVSREMGIPAVVGTGNATSRLIEGDVISVDGNSGKVYEGKGETKLAEIKQIVKTRTKIKVIVDLPNYAERAALSGANSVGLVRLEGIIAGSGKHPLYFISQNREKDYQEVIYSGIKENSRAFF